MQYWVEYATLIYFKILFVFWKACQDPPLCPMTPSRRSQPPLWEPLRNPSKNMMLPLLRIWKSREQLNRRNLKVKTTGTFPDAAGEDVFYVKMEQGEEDEEEKGDLLCMLY